jgi:uncharacterized membrane protein
MKGNSPNIEENSFLTPRFFGVSAAIILHLLIVLPLAYVLNIWVDEASSLYTTENGLFQAFRNVFADEKQAPLYFLLLSVWREMGHSIFFARSFSIIFSLLAIKVFYDLARKLFDAKGAGFITAVFAFHPFLIWASLEIRVYSLVILLSVLLLKFWFEINFQREDAKTQRRKEIFYVLISIAALYTNYYLGFLLVGNFCALLVLRKWREAKNYFLQMLLVGISILPLLWAIKAQFAANTNRFQADKSLVVGLKFLWNHFLTFVLPTEIFPPEVATNISFVRIWLVRLAILALVVLLVKRRKIFDKNIFAFGAICAVISGFILLAYFLLGEIFVEVRHAALLFAPLILFAGLVFREILTQEGREGAKARRFKSVFVISLSVLLLIFFSYSVYTLYPNLTKRGDWARVGAFIERNEKPNQPIIVFTAFDAICLPYNYRGVNEIFPDEKFFDWEFEAEAGSADSWRKQTEFIISEIPSDAPEIWLLTNEKCAVKDACAPLENYVEANYTIIEEKDFYKEKARLLRKK